MSTNSFPFSVFFHSNQQKSFKSFLKSKNQQRLFSSFVLHSSSQSLFQTSKNFGDSPFFLNYSFDKNRLKNLVSWFLEKNGQYQTILLLEKFKEFGFGYATFGGISLGIDDLHIPSEKIFLLAKSETSVTKDFVDYKNAKITGIERMQRFIYIWNQTNDNLKQDVLKYFETTDLFNPIFMMAFSGARGNMSQVRQLVGMRGLMSDPQGQIIDFPIQSNFREGLSLTEYLISTYGARKGIVDTALRTATAGYLTRRLVDVAQHVIVSKFDCGTMRGIFVFDMKEANKTIYSFQNRLIGRVLAEDICFVDDQNQQPSSNILAFRNQEINEELGSAISKMTKKAFVRSPLTCETSRLICQLCYGWSLSRGKLVSIGEAVGIIAAQSIGEPGTQLTMRTFHTGGVFAGGLTDQILAPFDGKIQYVENIPGNCIRTSLSKIAFFTKMSGSFFLERADAKSLDFQKNRQTTTQTFQYKKETQTKLQPFQKGLNFSEIYNIPPYAILFVKNHEFVSKRQLLAQFSSLGQKQVQFGSAEQTFFSNLAGELYIQNRNMYNSRSKNLKFLLEKRNQNILDLSESEIQYDIFWKAKNWTNIWVLSGKIFFQPFQKRFFLSEGDFIQKNSILQQILWKKTFQSDLHFPRQTEKHKNLFSFFQSFRSLSTNFGDQDPQSQYFALSSAQKNFFHQQNSSGFQRDFQNIEPTFSKNSFFPLSLSLIEKKKFFKNSKAFLRLSKSQQMKMLGTITKIDKRIFVKFGNQTKFSHVFPQKKFLKHFRYIQNFQIFDQKAAIFANKKTWTFQFFPFLHSSRMLKPFSKNFLSRTKSDTFQKKSGFFPKFSKFFQSLKMKSGRPQIFRFSSQTSIFQFQKIDFPKNFLQYERKPVSLQFQKLLFRMPFTKVYYSNAGYSSFFSHTNERNYFQSSFKFFQALEKKDISFLENSNFFSKEASPFLTYCFPKYSQTNSNGIFSISSFSQYFPYSSFFKHQILKNRISHFFSGQTHLNEQNFCIFDFSVSIPLRKSLKDSYFQLEVSPILQILKTSDQLLKTSNFLNSREVSLSEQATFFDWETVSINPFPILNNLFSKSDLFYSWKKKNRISSFSGSGIMQHSSASKTLLSHKNMDRLHGIDQYTKRGKGRHQKIQKSLRNQKKIFLNFEVYTSELFWIPQEYFSFSGIRNIQTQKTDFFSPKSFFVAQIQKYPQIFLSNFQGKKKELHFLLSGIFQISSLPSSKVLYSTIQKNKKIRKNAFQPISQKLSYFQKSNKGDSKKFGKSQKVFQLFSKSQKPRFFERKNHIWFRDFCQKNFQKKLSTKTKFLCFPKFQKSFSTINQLFDNHSRRSNKDSFGKLRSRYRAKFSNPPMICKARKNGKFVHFLQSSCFSVFPFQENQKKSFNSKYRSQKKQSFRPRIQGTENSLQRFEKIQYFGKNEPSWVYFSSNFPTISQMHQFVKNMGNFSLPDIVFEQNKIFLKTLSFSPTCQTFVTAQKENLFLSKKKVFQTHQNSKPKNVFSCHSVSQNSNSRFFKPLGKNTTSLDFHSFLSVNRNFALSFSPMQYRILQNPENFKKFFSKSTLQSSQKFSICFLSSSDLYKQYHSYILNSQKPTIFFAKNFGNFDVKVSSNFQKFQQKTDFSKKWKKEKFQFVAKFRKNQKPFEFRFQKNDFLKKFLSFQIYSFRYSRQKFLNLLHRKSKISLKEKPRSKKVLPIFHFMTFQDKFLQPHSEASYWISFFPLQFSPFCFSSFQIEYEKNFFPKTRQLAFFKNSENLHLSINFFTNQIEYFSIQKKSTFLNQRFFSEPSAFFSPAQFWYKNDGLKFFPMKEFFYEYESQNSISQKFGNMYQNSFFQKNENFWGKTKYVSAYEGEVLSLLTNKFHWWKKVSEISTFQKFDQLFTVVTKSDIFKVNFESKKSNEFQISSFLQPKQKICLKLAKYCFQKESPFQKDFQIFLKDTSSFQNFEPNGVKEIPLFLSKYEKKIYKFQKLKIGYPNIVKKPFLGKFVVYGDSFLHHAFTTSGQVIHLDFSGITFRIAQPFLSSPNGIVHFPNIPYIQKNVPILTLPYQTVQSGDIVQGIPKVEQFFEARTTIQGRLFISSLPILLKGIFERYKTILPLEAATRQSFLKIQQIIVDGVQRVYRSQGVSITDKHLEIVVRQMTTKVQIIHGGQTGFFPGEIVNIDLVERMNHFLLVKIQYEPIILGITRASLEVESFLSASSFQQTTKILSSAALSRKKDFLKGLKENLLVGNLIPSGTGYFLMQKKL